MQTDVLKNHIPMHGVLPFAMFYFVVRCFRLQKKGGPTVVGGLDLQNNLRPLPTVCQASLLPTDLLHQHTQFNQVLNTTDAKTVKY